MSSALRIALALVVLAPVPARAATVTGTVTWAEPVPFPGAPASRDPQVCGRGGPVSRRSVSLGPKNEVAGAVVRAVAEDGPPLPPERAVVRVVGCRFEPRVLLLGVGSEVRFRSEDPVLHNVTVEGPEGAALSSVNLVTAGQISPPVSLDAPGRYRVRSRAGHRWMNAHILVLERGPAVRAGPRGGYRLEGVPASARRVEAWHPDLGVTEHPLASTDAATATVTAPLVF